MAVLPSAWSDEVGVVAWGCGMVCEVGSDENEEVAGTMLGDIMRWALGLSLAAMIVAVAVFVVSVIVAMLKDLWSGN